MWHHNTKNGNIYFTQIFNNIRNIIEYQAEKISRNEMYIVKVIIVSDWPYHRFYKMCMVIQNTSRMFSDLDSDLKQKEENAGL